MSDRLFARWDARAGPSDDKTQFILATHGRKTTKKSRVNPTFDLILKSDVSLILESFGTCDVQLAKPFFAGFS
jgi:hypothetical protein